MWGVCSIKPRQIELAITNLARQGYGTFNPIFKKRKLDRRRKLITVNEPLFLYYLFVELLDGQRWPPINSTYGVNRLLSRRATGSEHLEPARIADTFIEQLQSCSTVNDKQEWTIPIGTTVRIARGPFAAHHGTLAAWSSADRCRLLVRLMGRETVVEVRGADIVAVEQSLT
jgi:transcription antitermination factor NusG